MRLGEVLGLNQARGRIDLPDRPHGEPDRGDLVEEDAREYLVARARGVPQAIEAAEAGGGQWLVDRRVGVEPGIAFGDPGREGDELRHEVRGGELGMARTVAVVQESRDRPQPQLAHALEPLVRPAPVRSGGPVGLDPLPQHRIADRGDAERGELVKILDTLVVPVQPCLVDQLVADPGHGAFQTAPHLQRRPARVGSSWWRDAAGASPERGRRRGHNRAAPGPAHLSALRNTDRAGFLSGKCPRGSAWARTRGLARTCARAWESIRVGSCARFCADPLRARRCSKLIGEHGRRLAMRFFRIAAATCGIAGAKPASSINEKWSAPWSDRSSLSMAPGTSTSAATPRSRWRMSIAGGRAPYRRPGRRSVPRTAPTEWQGLVPAHVRAARRVAGRRRLPPLRRRQLPRAGAREPHARRPSTRAAGCPSRWRSAPSSALAPTRSRSTSPRPRTIRPSIPSTRSAKRWPGSRAGTGRSAGIWQSVLLERRAPDHIRLVRLRPQRNGGAGRGDARSLTPAVGPARPRASDRRP